MDIRLLTVEVRFEQDVVLARGRSRQIASLLGFDLQSQTRIATAVSEISRNAFQYGGGGRVEFIVQDAALLIKVSDKGGGIKDVEAILAGRYTSTTGMGLGIVGAKRLMDKFVIESVVNETTVTLTKFLPKQTPITPEILQKIAQELAQKTPENLYQEVQQQNQELLRTMEELQSRSSELARLNSQLEDTNRGVVTLYAELDDRAESWQKASEMKTRFLSNMSHEFRTPLNAILSLSQLLLERLDGELNSEQEKQVNFIRTSALGLSELVNDLLDIAKVEAGKVTIRPQQFEVSDLFNALKGILRPILNQSEVNLVFDQPQNLPMYTDEGKVSQILRNLISNALKFTPKGEIRVSALKQERTIVFTVADTGIGIAPNNLELIFEEFVQIENPLQSQFKGTGLGLPLCRQLAQLLGGNISVESKLEVGSIFTVTLPCVYAEEKETVSPQTPIKVLIIDDEQISRYLLKELLKSLTIKVTEAINGSEGVIKAILEQPQVIFLDLVMPELSGFEVLEQLKANPTTKHIPVIIHTSKQLEPEERDRLINAQVVAILSKDLERPDAEAIIRQVLLKAGLHLNI
ncbi:ATP-binding protein [Chlorogloea sp. CCALA 695]|uniref:ATP-binding protein n=1 Tax=Chlorogloea sp. CCALA 695 TaxID=2107693 RepID=UPI000D04B4DC|nr:ATP-binding protein [Chlorogloea sp. CCALA 695]PSB34231.1 histidine kinase [Chlorogloea sp. CCALA 695]